MIRKIFFFMIIVIGLGFPSFPSNSDEKPVSFEMKLFCEGSTVNCDKMTDPYSERDILA